jgi:hypothetical protein
VFDISFNSIGGGLAGIEYEQQLILKNTYMNAWADCFKQNSILIHVDISYNSLRLYDMKVIGESLKTNHSILGIHIMGNEGEVDKKGFVNAEIENAYENNSIGKVQFLTRINTIFD